MKKKKLEAFHHLVLVFLARLGDAAVPVFNLFRLLLPGGKKGGNGLLALPPVVFSIFIGPIV